MKFPEIDYPPYMQAVATHERMQLQAAEATVQLERLHGDLAGAIEADDTDRSRAAVEGKRDPGRRREDKVRAAISESVDQVRILGQAAEQTELDVHDLLATDTLQVQAAATAAVELAEEQYRQAIAQVQDTRAAFWAAKRLRSWTTHPTGRAFSAGQAPGLAAMSHLTRNAEPMDAGLVWAALEAEVTVQVPPRQALRYDTRVERVMGGRHVLEEFSVSTPVFADDQ